MKKTTLIKTMLLLCALIVGSSNLWADDVNVLNEDFSSNNTKTKLEEAGWSFDGNLTFGNTLQVASGNGSGRATTPAFSSLVGSTATLTFSHVSSSGTKTRTLTITGVNCKVNGNTSTTVSVPTGNSGATTATINITNASTSSKITFSAANDQGTKIDDVVIYYTTTSSSPLASIALSGTYPTTFAVGDAFSHEGMTVTATYEDESTNNVTAKASFSGYNMSSTGTQEVTVSYTEGAVTKTAKYNITVKALANLAFSPASKNVALGSEEIISFSKTTDADVDFDVEDETIATYDPSTGKVRGLKEGTTKITATSAATSSYTAGSATCTIKVLDPSWIDLTAQGYDNADDVTTVDGSNGTLTFAIGTNKSNNPKWYDSGSAVRLYTGNTLKITAKTGFLLTDLEFSVTSGSMVTSGFSSTVTSPASNKFVLSTPANEITYSTGSNFRIDMVKVNIAAPVTITSAGFATLYTAEPLNFATLSSELKAYTASVEGSTVTLTQVNDIPANTGVVLKGSAKTHNIPVIASSSTAKGDLTGSTTEATAYNAFSGYDLYMLALNGKNEAQFTLANAGEIAAGKAFLKLTHSEARNLSVVFGDDETTAIRGIENGEMKVKNSFFDLQGRRVAQPTKGLYIVNGKKVIIK